MATSTRIVVDPENTGPWQIRQTAEAAAKVSELLQEDLEKHHVFFNHSGFHNHISHQLLSLYGTGAPPAVLQAAYDHNKGYQLPAQPPHTPQRDGFDAAAGSDWYEATAVKKGLLGRGAFYADFLRFFQHDIATSPDGWQGVVARRLLADAPAAHDLLLRLFAGFLHPLIQLMYGLAWRQPAMVAQGLAQAAVHRLEGVEKYLSADDGVVDGDTEAAEESILSLYKLVGSASGVSGNDGAPAARVSVETVAKRVRVRATPTAVATRTAEMAETAVYVAASAALHSNPRKQPRFDFFLIHHVNSLPFFFALNALDDTVVPVRSKARLLAYKIRMDLVQYATQAYPPLLALPEDAGDDDIQAAATATAHDISPAAAAAAARLFPLEEDGHAIKLVLATGVVERAVHKDLRYADAPWRLLRTDAAWRALYRVETESVQGPDSPWVRKTGLASAWADVPDKPQQTN